MEIRNKINEKHFNLEIYEWDDFTLDLLKSYSDWKCNGKQVPVVPPVDVPVTIEKQPESNAEDSGSHKYSSPCFTENEVICKKSEYGNISIYKPVINFLLKHLSGEFTRIKLRNVISNCYAVNGRSITDGSAQVYSCSYRRYMIDVGLIKQVGDNFKVVEKKNQS